MALETIPKPPQHMYRRRNVRRRRLVRRRCIASSPGAAAAIIYKRIMPDLFPCDVCFSQRGNGRVFGIYMHNWDVNEEREGR